MDNNLLYWLIEYGKVLFGYGFLMFVWPLTIFRGYLKNKSVTFKFSFCVTAQMIIVNTVVLMLGLLHILNDWTLRILFYGSFLYSIRACFALTKERKTTVKYLVHGSFGVKNFIWLKCRKYIRKLEGVIARFGRFYKKHWMEYSLLVVAVVYGVVYFSWGVFHDRSFGFSDMYVHHQWIYQLSEGNPFSAGIYPEGMHCLIYALNALFGTKIYSCLLFVSSANIILVLLSVYCLFKEIYRWRLSSVLTLGIFLTLGAVGGSIITCMSRLQCALPQEFAFPEVFLCMLFLLRYLKSCHGTTVKGKQTKWYWNENLVVFGLALASTIAIHFYATFMAFFLCVGVAIALIKRVFTKERFVPLIMAIFLGVMIALIPMVVAFASGIRLQGSLYWAMSIMDIPSGDSDNTVPEFEPAVPSSPKYDDIGSAYEQGNNSEIVEPSTDISVQVIPEKTVSLKEKLMDSLEKAKTFFVKLWKSGIDFFTTLYYSNYRVLYEAKFAKMFAICHVAVLFIGVLVLAIKLIFGKGFHYERVLNIDYNGYIMLLLTSFVYSVVYCSQELDLPVLIDKSRICAIIFLLDIVVMVSVFDMVFYLTSILIPERILQMVSLSVIAWIIATISTSEYYHGLLYFELSRFDSTVQITNQIIEDLPDESFTIVSPTEELYQVIEYGYHEELVTFLRNQKNEHYTLPTEFVFVYVEKKPLDYVQIHSFSGPRWLAGERYRDIMYKGYGDSIWPKYIGAEISEEEAEKPLMYFSNTSGMYTSLASRTIIESKMYYWCEAFRERYPNEVKVYYEDDYVICYYWKQNQLRLYDLVIE